MVIMNSRNFRIFVVASSVGLVAGCPAGASAQAPAGPLPAAQPQPPSSPDARPAQQAAPVKPRTSIMGGWKLNRDESDDPRQKMQDARGADNGRGGGGGRGRGGGPQGDQGMGGGTLG